MNETLDMLYVTSPPDMGSLLARELEELDIPVQREMRGGVYVEKSIAVGYKVCLWSRIANRVLWPLVSFRAPDEDLLYDGVKAFPWEEHLKPDGTLAIDANCVQSGITHSHYTALRTKDAIVDRFRDQTGERPSVDLNNPDLQINTYLFKDDATLSIDLAGQSLYRRGYRTAGLEAPLKENLAAGLLYRAGWPKIAAEGGALVDPMCGTGTFLVEAAMMACRAAPGLLKNECGVSRWLMHDPLVWTSLVEEAVKLRVRGARELVFGYDWDKRAVQTAQQHAKQAGVDGLIHVEEREVKSAVPPPGVDAGLMITNPPYGQRMGEAQKLSGLYQKLGERLRGYWPGWTAAVFTGNPPLISEIRLKPRRTYDFKNGSIPCRFAMFKLASAERMKEQISKETGVEMLENRLARNIKHFGKWARRNGITCYRLYDGDIPEYPFSVDLYTDVDDVLAAHITVSETKDDGLLGEARLAAGIESVRRALSLREDNVIVKSRSRQVGESQYERLEKSGSYVTVKEGNARFLVNLTDFHDTGLFLDNRFVRAYVQKRSKGMRLLNLFGYTGSVSVCAALGGAVASTTIDLSNTYIDWARRNYEANGLDPEAHQLVRADCLGWLREAEKGLQGDVRFDVIYFDPPTFSNSKAMDGSFDVLRDHTVWIERALNLLSEEGQLIFRCNRRGFAMGFENESYSVKDISKQTLAVDFERRANTHHCFEIGRRLQSRE
jgi:23S rRNA (guanine2445-N2)-methyltransferase / 23S rRNA (guanine2069-N7)-methyltransferase